MPGEDVFKFIGACHLSVLIKEHEYDIHRDMIRHLDEVFTVSDVSNKTEYRVRLKSQIGSNVMVARHHSAKPEKQKHGYGSRDNRRNRSKPEVTEEKPDEKPEGTNTKSNRQQDPDEEPSTQSVRYVKPIDWTTRSYHTRVSTHKSENAKESSRALEHGVNGRKRAPLKKGKSKRKGKPKSNGSSKQKTVANQFAIYKVDGGGREGNHSKPDRVKLDPYVPGVSRICYTCAEVLSVCKCDEEPDSDKSCLISPAQSRPTSPVQPRATSPDLKVPSNWTRLFQ